MVIIRQLSEDLDIALALASMPDDTCVHHWMIEPANGEYSTGECKKCGQLRSFTNRAISKYGHDGDNNDVYGGVSERKWDLDNDKWI
jgi:hypothetical protein